MRKIFILFFSLSIFGVSNGQQLNAFLEEALSNNPEIQTFDLKYQVAKEKSSEAKALPDTRFGLGYFVSEPETRTGAQRFKISANQMLPSFGAITARENYLNSLADALYEDIVIAKRKLVVSVSKSYYNLYAIKEKQMVLKKTISLLKTFEELALKSLESGGASAVAILRLQIRQNELDQFNQVLEQEYLAERTTFNKLIHRAKDTQVTLDTKLEMPTEKDLMISDNLSFHPELLKYDKLYNSVEQSELLNKVRSNPKLGFGIDYVGVSQRPDIDIADNGKDILMPMVSVSIPIFNPTFKSKTKQNELKRKEILAQKESRLNALETLLDKAIKSSNSAQIKYNTQSENLKQAKDAETILLKNYEAGTLDFSEVLAIEELQLRFQMDQIEALKTFYVQRTIINYLTF